MNISENHIEEIRKYFHDFTVALEAHLRLLNGRLSNYWGAIDKGQFSTLLYITEKGIVARVICRWLGSHVVVKRNMSFSQATVSSWTNNNFNSGNRVFCSVIAKHLSGGESVEWHVENDGKSLKVIPMDDFSSVLLVGPVLFRGLSSKQAEQLAKKSTVGLSAAGLEPPRAPWLVTIISSNLGINTLKGLDPEPYIAAKGVADIISSIDGLQDEDPAVKYRKARSQLCEAIKSNNSENESNIHTVITKNPWILLDEVDYKSVWSEKTLNYTERVNTSNNEIIDQHRSIRPDFVYEMYDDKFLIVEIEAATKKLLKEQLETGYQLPTASSVAAQFQILNYKQVCSGSFGEQIKAQLNKASNWGFKHLLVVGSDKQENFDKRSWNQLQSHFAPHDIAVKDWDYYVDRLERYELAATTNRTPRG